MTPASQSYPVVTFVRGGAWVIGTCYTHFIIIITESLLFSGYKMWSVLVVRALSMGVVVCPDYRNVPQ